MSSFKLHSSRRGDLTSYQNFCGTEDLAEGPGPGAYNPPSTIGAQKQKITIKHKYDLYNKVNVPGPGTYDPKPMIGTGQKNSIGHARKGIDSIISCSPGPAAYHQRAVVGGRLMASFKSRHRDGRDRTTVLDNPGPDAYNTRTYPGRDVPAATIGQRLPRTDHMHTNLEAPGPGRYDPTTSLSSEKGDGSKKSPAFSMGIRHATELDYQKSHLTPGPGHYSIKSSIGPRGLTKSIGHQTQRPKTVSDTPGPGSYTPRRPNIRGHTFTSRATYKPPDVSPGSAHYNIKRDLGRNVPAYTIRFKPRGGPSANYIGTHSPGPAAYNVPSRIGEKGSLTAKLKGRSKMSLDSTSDTPGPIYNPRITNKKRAPMISMHGDNIRGKIPDPEDVVPGPGAYNPNKPLGVDRPKVTIKHRKRPATTTDLETPGAGRYDQRYKSIGNGGQAKTMGARFYATAYEDMMRRHKEDSKARDRALKAEQAKDARAAARKQATERQAQADAAAAAAERRRQRQAEMEAEED